ncbi:MAG: hypothetical protein KAH97_03010 [Anaerolineales bacterium]|nr:hypothetical protein [Anaerolineales bacterium]
MADQGCSSVPSIATLPSPSSTLSIDYDVSSTSRRDWQLRDTTGAPGAVLYFDEQGGVALENVLQQIGSYFWITGDRQRSPINHLTMAIIQKTKRLQISILEFCY